MVDHGSNGNGARKSRTEMTYDVLKDDILKGRLPPETLLLEHELAQRFGVSKTPIREALRRLINDGWVIVIPRRGYLVKQLRLEDVREIFALREAIETALLPDAARRASPEALDALVPWIDAQRSAASDDRDEAFLSGRSFHLELARLSGNARGERILAGLLDEVRRLHHVETRLDTRLSEKQELEDHRHVVEALREGRSGDAVDVMRSHLRESLRQMVAVLTEY